GCRSTAPGANRSGTHSHPRRVLLRYGVVAGVFVGAPPRCEPGKHTFAPEAGAPTTRGGGRLVVGAPPRCEPGKHTFAPEAGAPTIRGGGRCVCRSTALGANGAGTHSHPRRVLLRYGVEAGSFVGAPPPVRTGQAHIRTRGGCSYDTRWWQACCRSTAPGANRASTHSHPRRVLLRYGVVAGVFVGAPPDRRTAPVRTGPAHVRTRCGCSYK